MTIEATTEPMDTYQPSHTSEKTVGVTHTNQNSRMTKPETEIWEAARS